MRLRKALILGFISIVPAACLVVPVRSTYYEPNAMDGTPERSNPASKRQDNVGREVDGLYVRVHAESTPGQNLIVGIRINCHDGSIGVNPNPIELHSVAEFTFVTKSWPLVDNSSLASVALDCPKKS